MLNRPMSRLATVVAAAGTVCALGAASASAMPAGSWSGPKGPVPDAFTNTTPALSQVFLSATKHGTLVAWKGQFNNEVHYKLEIGGKWLASRVIPRAVTGSAPAVGSYRDPNGHQAVLAVWKQLGGDRLYYSQGETHSNGTISWTGRRTLVSDSTSAPSLIFPAHAPFAKAIVAWRGPFDHVRYSVGSPVGRNFTWTKSNWIGAPANIKTNAAPSLAEGPGASAGHGTLYVFWKGYKSSHIRYATTTDPLKFSKSKFLTWSKAKNVPGAATDANPAASSLGARAAGPIQLAYKVPHKLAVRFQTLTGTVWSTSAVVPSAETAVGPALLTGELATTSDNSSASILLHFFS